MSRELLGLSYGGNSLAARYGLWPKTRYCSCGEYAPYGIEGWGPLCRKCIEELATWPGYEWIKRQGII